MRLQWPGGSDDLDGVLASINRYHEIDAAAVVGAALDLVD